MAAGADKKIGKCQGYESGFRTFVLLMGECYFHGEASKISISRRNALWQK